MSPHNAGFLKFANAESLLPASYQKLTLKDMRSARET